MQPFNVVTAATVALPKAHIDTDQIIPARFLKITDKQGLGEALFADWRVDAEGRPRPDFVLNRPEHRGAEILVAGDNFGCGSSREHAPWALLAFGFRAVISTSFADIFRNNAGRNGLLPVVVDADFHAHLLAWAPAPVTVDLEACTVVAGPRRTTFTLEPFARYCLLHGQDQLDYLLSLDADIRRFEEAHA